MKPSTLAISLLASAWGTDIAIASLLRNTQETVTGPEPSMGDWGGDGHDPCATAKATAVELLENALIACGTAAANPSWGVRGGGTVPDQGLTSPNPTCLLLLCAAKRVGRKLVAAEDCADAAPPPALEDDVLCNLTPGLVPPESPVANNDETSYVYAIGTPVTVNVIDNDEFTFGEKLELVEITEQPTNGMCEVSGCGGNGCVVVYTPDWDSIDDGDQFCTYKACYVGGQGDRIIGRWNPDMCDTATVTITVTGAPTPTPTTAPTVENCELSVEATPGPFPPAGFDPNEECGGRPKKMTFKYNGGKCDQTDTALDTDKYTCVDYNGGPPTEGQNRIAISEPKFHQGVVVGSTFDVSDGSQFPSDLEIWVYADGTMTTKLQYIKFHSSCSKTLLLSDKIGSIQIFGFKSDNQDASLYQPLSIATAVTNTGDLDATLTSLLLEVNGDITQLIDGDVPLAVNATYQPKETQTLVDTTVGTITYSATVMGGSANGGKCDETQTVHEVCHQEFPDANNLDVCVDVCTTLTTIASGDNVLDENTRTAQRRCTSVSN